MGGEVDIHRRATSPQAPRWRWLIGVLLAYFVVAYLLMPLLEEHQAKKHPDLANAERITQTKTGLPGDPVNLAVVGSDRDLVAALVAASWRPADALSFASSVRIVADTLLAKPDVTAPVSNLYLFGRKEDLAFEKPIGHSPKERHHVRFWRSALLDEGRPLWYGAATHDVGVEFSHTTGQITHRIAPDVDTERDLLIGDLVAANAGSSVREIVGFHKVTRGRNGGGDPWYTDGTLRVVAVPVKSGPTPP